MRRTVLALVSTLACVALSACGQDADDAGTGSPASSGSDLVELEFLLDGEDPDAARRSASTLRERFDALDLDGASFEVSGSTLSLTVPPGSESLVRTTMLTRGRLELRPVLATLPEGEVTPPGELRADDDVVLASEDGVVHQLGPVVVDGTAFEHALAARDELGMWVIDPVFHEGARGIDQFNAAAAQCYSGEPTCPAVHGDRGQLAIVLDGVVLSAPSIHVPSFERDQIQISGGFDEHSARALALALRFGASSVDVVEAD